MGFRRAVLDKTCGAGAACCCPVELTLCRGFFPPPRLSESDAPCWRSIRGVGARRATGGWVPTKLGMAWWRGLGKTRLGSSFFWEVLRRNPGRMTVLCLIGIQTVFGESNGPNVKQIEQPAAITASCTFMGDAACWSDAVHSLCEYHLLEMLPTLASFADRRPVRIETTLYTCFNVQSVHCLCALLEIARPPLADRTGTTRLGGRSRLVQV